MAEEESTSVPLSQAADPEDPAKTPPASPSSSTRKACCVVLQSWVSKKFMTGCVVLFPVAVTFFITWWFIQFVDGFFSPLYAKLGVDILGLGFLTSLVFVFLVGIFVSSWLGASVFWLGEWFIKRMPFVKHIYSASKQISTAISPAYYNPPPPEFKIDNEEDKKLYAACNKLLYFRKMEVPLTRNFVSDEVYLQKSNSLFYFDPSFLGEAQSEDQNTTAFKEVAIICHPRVGEYAFGFITSYVVLQVMDCALHLEWVTELDGELLQLRNTDKGDEELCSVYVPTNHLYIGDIFLVNSEEIIRPNLSIREGIEIIVSGGMTMPQLIAPLERLPRKNQSIRLNMLA